MAQYATGAAAAKEAAKSDSFTGKVEYLTIAEGEHEYVRMLTDHPQWITVQRHVSVPTKGAPKSHKGNWPEHMNAVCQNGDQYRLRDADGEMIEPPQWEEGYGHCYICEHMQGIIDKFKKPVSQTNARTYALCVLRDPVTDPTTGRIKAFKDRMEDFTDSNKEKYKVPAIRVVSQAYRNWFGPMYSTAYISDTVVRCDYKIERTGNDYDASPSGETSDHHPGTESWQIYEDTLKLRNLKLLDVIEEQASPEYYAKFFDKRVATKAGDTATPTDDEAEAAAAAPADGPGVVSETDIDDFKARLQRSVGATADGSKA